MVDTADFETRTMAARRRVRPKSTTRATSKLFFPSSPIIPLPDMSEFDDILALALPTNDPKTEACRSLKMANELVRDTAKTQPDDKEELEEDQELWLKEWRVALVRHNVSRAPSQLTVF